MKIEWTANKCNKCIYVGKHEGREVYFCTNFYNSKKYKKTTAIMIVTPNALYNPPVLLPKISDLSQDIKTAIIYHRLATSGV